MNKIVFASANGEPCPKSADKYYKIIVAEGKCALQYADGKIEFGMGQVAVVPPLIKYSLSGASLAVYLEQALLSFGDVGIISDDGARGIEHAAKQAMEYLRAESSDKSVLAALGGLIVAYITEFSGGEKLSPVVAAVRKDIQKNLSTPSFSLEDSIKQLPLNYDYVRKLFKKETGLTPHEYLMNSRMKLANELISSGIGNKYSNYSVGQIAEACGFSEPLYFSRVFKKYFGISPSEACKKARNS